MLETDFGVAHEYFASLSPDNWRWSEDGDSLGWVNGPTLTFRAELASILEPWRSKGLPPLLPLLMVLATQRQSWPESALRLTWLARERMGLANPLPAWVTQVMDRLDSLHSPPKPADSRFTADLVRYLFEDEWRRAANGKLAAAVLESLSDPISPEFTNTESSGKFDILPRLRVLGLALDRFDVDDFRRWRETSVPGAVLPVEVERESSEQIRALLVELSEDAELGGVARVARRLASLVTLPKPLSSPDEAPLGGFSDIANRGTLDRLLLGELAHDDLTLAARVANREALYIRRESPPRPPPSERLVLLDCGTRMWGTPRLFATAVGWAMAGAKDKSTKTSVYRAAGERLAEVDCRSRAGIETHLQALESAAHPGDALAALADEWRRVANREAVIVTSEQALGDAEFLRAWRGAELAGSWLITVTRAGRLRLLRGGRAGFTLVREGTIELDRLLRAEKPRPILIEGSRVPAYCRLEPPPLRVPYDPPRDREWLVPDRGLLAVTHDGRVLWWTDRRFGPRQIGKHSRIGNLLWADGRVDGARTLALIGSLAGRMRFLEIDFDRGQSRLLELPRHSEGPFDDVFGVGDFICLRNRRRVVAISRDGSELRVIETSEALPHISREFYGSSSRVHLWRLNPGVADKPFVWAPSLKNDWLYLWHSPVSETVRGIRCSGEIEVVKPGAEPRIVDRIEDTSGFSIEHVSRDGQRVFVRSQRYNRFLIDLEAGKRVQVDSFHPSLLEPQRPRYFLGYPNPRNRFLGITVRDGLLTLISERKHALPILTESTGFALKDLGRVDSSGWTTQCFEKTLDPDGARRARWDSGHEAWLDPRGLLHLRHETSNQPELTFVLCEGQTAGWCSNGGVFGQSYFLGPGEFPDVAPVARQALQAFVRGIS